MEVEVEDHHCGLKVEAQVHKEDFLDKLVSVVEDQLHSHQVQGMQLNGWNSLCKNVDTLNCGCKIKLKCKINQILGKTATQTKKLQGLQLSTTRVNCVSPKQLVSLSGKPHQNTPK